MMKLTLYENAKQALALLTSVDEVKDIHIKAKALQRYAFEAKDPTLIDHATEVRLRAERRAGELLRDMKDSGERETGGRPENSRSQTTVTLKDLEITRDQSSRWQNLAKLDEQAFEERVARAQKDAVASVEMTAIEKAEAKRERRTERETVLAAKIAELPGKRYGVIYADPPWRFEVYSQNTGMDRAADNHYPTMALDDIFAIPVGTTVAADDCVLFLWATAPMLPSALEVVTAWGFEYKSHAVWLKDRIGTGYWFRNRHEILIVATKGNVPAPAPGTQWESVTSEEVGEHSEKPLWALHMIEEYFPTLPKIELFARQRRAGWDCWGLEAPEMADV